MSDKPKKPSPTIGDLKQAILSQLNFLQFYSKHMISGETLREDSADGWSNRVLCPIHQDKSTPNFFVNLRNGSFACHACGAHKDGGSVFDFWLIRNNRSPRDKRNFRFALEALAMEAGIQIADFKKNFQGSGTPSLPASEQSGTKEAVEEASFIPKHSKADQIDKTTEPIPVTTIQTMQAALRTDHWKYLNQKRGLKKKTIEDYQIGWDETAVTKSPDGTWLRGRYSIPIFDKEGKCRNIRLYSNLGDPQFKMLNYCTDKDTPRERKYGRPARLMNLHRMVKGQYDNIVICEGEWKCILLNQYLEEAGLASWLAVTGTHGANTFEAEWLEYLFDKHIYFCFDCDEPGKVAALNHVNKFFLRPLSAGKFLSVRIVELPLDGSKEMKDLGDYFLKGEYSCDDFIKLCVDTPEMMVGGVSGDEGIQEPILVSDFVTAIKDRRYIDQRIQVPISISGTTSKVYHAIRTYAVTRCPLTEKGEDQCCSSMSSERTIPYGHSLFIEACMEREGSLLRSIAHIACQKDQKCTVQAVTKVVMEEYFAHQVVKRWKAEEDEDGHMQNAQELVQTSVYILQPPNNISIQPQNYSAIGYVRTHPKTSIATLFIEQMIPVDEDWKKFTVESPENRLMLQTLKTDFSTEDIINDLRNGVTRIYKMDEILITVLLTYLTPLWIHFNGNLQRGWVNACIIGDSGTGKSKTYERFSEWVEQGDLFSALSGTRTGFLYSIKKKSDEWHVQIGRYVQASRKIIALDETQKMARDEIEKMAIAMDTGWLEVQQVASGGYHTQTRTLFLMNPKDAVGNAATISDFTYGCDALRMCFDYMFIRRLDMALFTTGQQEHEFYNQKNEVTREKIAMRLTPRMMRTLIFWAWTRRSDQVIWTDEATNLCLKTATELSKEYGDADHVPLMNPQDLREKLARLSVAYAILSRNFTPDFECVTVLPEHVISIANFIDHIYSAPACNLRQRSKLSRTKNTLDDFDKIRSAFEAVVKQAQTSTDPIYRQGDCFLRFLLCLQTMRFFRKKEISDQLNISMKWVSKRIMILQGYNLIEISKTGGFAVTKKFNLFMQRWTKNPEIEKLLAEAQEKAGRDAMNSPDEPRSYEPEYYDSDPFDSSQVPNFPM